MYCLRDYKAILVRGEEVELERMPNTAWAVNRRYVSHGDVLLCVPASGQLNVPRPGLSPLPGWRYRMHSVIELHGPRLHATSRCGADLTFGTLGDRESFYLQPRRALKMACKASL
jgi:hypothetical protein